jgi:membrane-associated phospholipid phosphatase
LIGYLVFFTLNYYLNGTLKNVIKQPRPKESKSINTLDTNHGSHEYGMPSGHAQWVFFNTTYLYLVKKNIYLLMIDLFISALTLYQRYKYKRHTIEQLVVGSLVGTVAACVSVYLTYAIIKILFR